jgi:hypothetical protein
MRLCLFEGYNLTTLYAIGYNVTGEFDNPSEYVVRDGDGTVTTEGLEVCSNWVIVWWEFVVICERHLNKSKLLMFISLRIWFMQSQCIILQL